jgi:hypothetical protein
MKLGRILIVGLVALAFATTGNAGVIVDQDFIPVAGGDNIPDVFDNCPFHKNGPASAIKQTDTDGDGRGNRCDADFDGDIQALVSDFTLMLGVFPGPVSGADLQFDMDGDAQVLVADLTIFLTFFPGPLCPLGELNPAAPNCP